jgi:hypothetical protein
VDGAAIVLLGDCYLARLFHVSLVSQQHGNVQLVCIDDLVDEIVSRRIQQGVWVEPIYCLVRRVPLRLQNREHIGPVEVQDSVFGVFEAH